MSWLAQFALHSCLLHACQGVCTFKKAQGCVWHASHVVCAPSLLRDDSSAVVLCFVSAAQHSIATLHVVPCREHNCFRHVVTDVHALLVFTLAATAAGIT